MTTLHPTSTMRLLNALYPHVMTLEEYIKQYIDLDCDSFDCGYMSFLNRIIVCSTFPKKATCISQRTLSLHDLITMVIQKALQNSRQQLLALGCRFSSDELETACISSVRRGSTRLLANGLERWYAGGLFDYSTSWITDSGHWERIYCMIGDQAMFELLYDNCLFATISIAAMKPLCYQLSGIPAHELELFKFSPGNMAINKSSLLYAKRDIPSVLCPLKRFHRCNSILLHGFIFKNEDKKLLFHKWIERILNRSRQCHYRTIFERYCSNESFSSISTKDYTSSYHNVFLFVKAILKRLFPRDFLNPDQEKILWRILKIFITQNKNETFQDIGLVLEWQKFKVSNTGVGQRMSNHDQNYSLLSLFKMFFVWLFQKFIIPLLTDRFYITETTHSKNQLVYVRHDVWILFTKRYYQDPKIFVPVHLKNTYNTINRCYNLFRGREFQKFPILRLIPKEKPGEFRQVVNMGKPSNRLKNVLHILTFERKDLVTHSTTRTASVLSFIEVSERLFDYLSRMRKNGYNGSFYMASVDITGCFDSIPHDLLLKFTEKILKSDSYTCIKYVHLYEFMNEMKRKFIRKVKRGIHVTVDFSDNFKGNGIFVDQVVHDHEYRTDVIQTLERHIKQHFVKLHYKTYENSESNKNVIYHQRVGIPQGSILSSILCSIFYDSMDLEQLSEWILDSNVLLLRYVDDFLCISTDKLKVSNFLEHMKRGIPKFNCFIHPDKIRTSFASENDSNLFRWCGLWIDKNYLSIRSSDGSLNRVVHASSLTVYYGRHPYMTLIQRAKYYLKSRLQGVYLSKLNPPNVIIENLLDNLELCAIRVRVYLRKLNRVTKRTVDDRFILMLRDQLIGYCVHITRTRISKTFVEPVTRLGKCAFQKHCINKIK